MIKKIALLTAILVVMCFGSAMAAQIDSLGSGTEPFAPPTDVFVNPGGLGDGLIYGYYNVRDNRNNFFSVVNTSSVYGVRARIRFLEAENINSALGLCQGSYEMLDFDICLSPSDVWSGVIRNVGGNATLFSGDTDTAIDPSAVRTRSDEGTNPDPTFALGFPAGVTFKTGSSTPQNITADQTLEGYFIVIAENQLVEVPAPLAGQPFTGNCGGLLLDAPQAGSVGNVLFGNNYMVDMDTFETFAYNATALGDFSNTIFLNQPQDANPNLSNGTDGLPGLNYALTKNNIFSIYDLEASVGGKTEIVVTFPTRQLTALAAGGITFSTTTGTCTLGNSDIFDDPRVLITVFDDQENSDQTICQFSPCKGIDVKLPSEVNVINMKGSTIFTSGVEVALTPSAAFDFGFISIDLVDAATSTVSPAHLTSFGGQTAFGLPLIGYTTLDFSGGSTTHMLPVQYQSNILD